MGQSITSDTNSPYFTMRLNRDAHHICNELIVNSPLVNHEIVESTPSFRECFLWIIL